MKKVNAIGIMSGSSLDGLDVALCEIDLQATTYTFVATDTIDIPPSMVQQLCMADQLSGRALSQLHVHYGQWIGDVVQQWIAKTRLTADIIGLHGHTVFHEPAEGVSLQIGHGSAIAVATGIPTITDVRSADVMLGGEGAPLAPLVNEVFFPDYQGFLNLGGIVNIHLNTTAVSLGLDICGCNQWLNALAQEKGKAYDDQGTWARSGKLNQLLYEQLHSTYAVAHQPSLSNQQVQNIYNRTILPASCSVEDKLHTCCQLIAGKIAETIKYHNVLSLQNNSIQASGGGCFNQFLVDCITSELNAIGCELVIPSEEIISHKESLLMALMAAYHLAGMSNYPKSCKRTHNKWIGGVLHPAKATSHG